MDEKKVSERYFEIVDDNGVLLYSENDTAPSPEAFHQLFLQSDTGNKEDIAARNPKRWNK